MTEITQLRDAALAMGAQPKHISEGVRFYRMDQCVIGLDPTNLQVGWMLDAGVDRFAEHRGENAPTTVTGRSAWRRGPFALGVTDRAEAVAVVVWAATSNKTPPGTPA